MKLVLVSLSRLHIVKKKCGGKKVGEFIFLTKLVEKTVEIEAKSVPLHFL